MRKLSQIKISKRQQKYGFEPDFYVFDTETNGLTPKPDKFIFGCIYGNNYKKVFYSVQEFKDEIKNKRYYKKTIFAHNLEFDLQAIYGNIFENLDNTPIYSGSALICCSPDKENKILFADSLNILKSSVKKIGDSIGLEKLEIENEYTKGNTDITEVTDKMVNYCFRDCEIIHTALYRFFKLIGKIKITIASSSMHYFLQNYLEKHLFYKKNLSDLFFKSYYGGRTEVFKFGKNLNLDVFDINSLYPFIMRNIDLPHPEYLKRIENPNINFFNKMVLYNCEGFADVEIFQNEKNYFGLLPYKDLKENKLMFPVGKFRTIVNLNELRFAVNHGAKILNVFEVVYSTKILKNLLTSFVDDLYKKRIETNDNFDKTTFKLLLNCLYGKFGSKQPKKKIYFKNSKLAIQYIKENNLTNYNFSFFNAKRKDLFLDFDSDIDLKFSIPLIASYITSGARIHLLKYLLKYKKEIYYCDTDSLFLKENSNLKHLILNNDLGNFKKENKKILEIRGLKNYTYLDTEKNKIVDAIKGVSKDSTINKNNEFEKLKYYKSKQALRQNKETGANFIQTKKLSNEYSKRKILKNLDTLPNIL